MSASRYLSNSLRLLLFDNELERHGTASALQVLLEARRADGPLPREAYNRLLVALLKKQPLEPEALLPRQAGQVRQ